MDAGAPIGVLYTTEHPEALDAVASALAQTLTIEDKKTEALPPLIYKTILGDEE